MGNNQLRRRAIWISLLVLGFCYVLCSGRHAFAQTDQGAITGIVEDTAGEVIPGAQVTLTNTDTGLILHGQSDASGVYVFSPVKIGNYNVSATASGFETTSQEHLHLDIQERLNVVIALKPGAVSQTVTVVSTAQPLLQTQTASVGQVMSTNSINNTPLNGRNWVYIAQLAAGVVPSTGPQGANGASRGGGTGDFFANGQRGTENDFILDGVDNNVNVDDFMNGASYNVRPPPDALAEFKIDTADYSAEFGHSAGGVLNASIKSGTNQIHGDVWEYFRNTVLDAKDWNALVNPPYHENQFGATLGFPILRNKLFYFGDAEANRVTIGSPLTLSVPTALMRQGNFSELLNPSLTGSAKPIQLYEPNSGGATTLSCNGQNNVFCGSQIDSIAQNLLNLFPSPNANGGDTYNNFIENINDATYTWQWDQRLDWNISAKDQIYSRYSYQHLQGYNPPPLGPILSGGVNSGPFEGTYDANMGQSFMASETHIFSSSLTNEIRFGYNWGHYSFLAVGYNTNVSAQLGLGGVPFGQGFLDNGGIPFFTVSGVSGFGTIDDVPSIETQNSYQILDNVTKIIGNHSLKFGVSLQNFRVGFYQPALPRAGYTYTGLFTSNLGASFTGSGVADFLADQMDSAGISPDTGTSFYRWYRAAYAQDDWRLNSRLTLNLGVRYDYFQPLSNPAGDMTNLVVTPQLGGIGTGTGILELPAKIQSQSVLPAQFLSLLATNNVTVQYIDSLSLSNNQKTNFAPRIGFAYQLDPKTVLRGGFGIFYAGLESTGGVDITVNYPWQFNAGVVAPSCTRNNCSSDAISLENGLSQQIAAGIQNFISLPTFDTIGTAIKTPYTTSYNLTAEHELSSNMVASIGYVGNVDRHLLTRLQENSADALVNPANNPQLVEPFPGFSTVKNISSTGVSTYNALQAKVQKLYANGLDFLATYTWAHALDDSFEPGGIEAGITARNTNLIPLIDEYTNSATDVRNRLTFSGFYQLPFGKGEAPHLHNGGLIDYVASGWTTSLTFVAQTGFPFTVSPNISTAAGGTANAILIRNPFAAGGTPDPSNPGVTCAAQTRNKTNWYNPCAFANPLPGSQIPLSGPDSQVTGIANVMDFLGGKSDQIYGPGYERVNASLFKDFSVYREQRIEFRADCFNLLNHPTLDSPSVKTDNSNGGRITGPLSLQNDTPDARFFQFAAKYVF